MGSQLLRTLKEKRREIAAREGKELFRVFQNAVLERTAEERPKTLADLENIKGWGSKKIQKYGREILGIINGDSPEKEPAASTDGILSVGQFISFINERFFLLGTLKVRGEIIEVNRHSSGYCFFSLKDSETGEHSVHCFMSRWKAESLSHLLEVGMEVVASARPSLYKNGRFSLMINGLEAYGEGALKKAFEALKRKLEARGYFDPSRKRPIPAFVKTIGIITSENGAAIKDFRKNVGEYGFEINLRDVRVEGDLAERSIISAIKWFNKNIPHLHVLVLIRGGGSLEELKAFNSEGIAEAIALSRIPVITGIGHERDESIADFVADMRFSTPTAAAVFLKNQRESLIVEVDECVRKLILRMTEILAVQKDKITGKVSELEGAFEEVTARYRSALSKMAERMHNGLGKIFEGFRTMEQNFLRLVYQHEKGVRGQLHHLELIAQNCLNLLERKCSVSRRRLEVAEAALLPLNPESVLKRGYSIAYQSGRKVLKEASGVQKGETIFIKLYKGEVTSQVEKVTE